ncbi:MAG: NAD(P)-binding domain-containing protein, partial [Kangiellaceae bacterium]|nr:NAD(P)-binding domain-containing protein [Kangiellaceae bacterium]
MTQNKLSEKSQFGIFGLGVMGKSLSRNFASKGIKLSIYNRHVDNTEVNIAVNFKDEYELLTDSQAFDQLSAFVTSLQTPRKILLMIKAGKTVDVILDFLTPLLDDGDIVIDGGNSHYLDTQKRISRLMKNKIHFLGCGISGGESGALNGPSLMPGGNSDAYKEVKDYLELIAATDKHGKPCCTYIGSGGSGNFVKTIHNGIEYVEMQLLAEVYFIYKKAGKTTSETAAILDSWRETVDSFLLDITITILRRLENGEPLLEKVLDKAGNKGTGNWSAISSPEL